MCVCLCLLLFSIAETQCFVGSVADGDPRMSSLSDRDLEYIRRVTRLLDLKGTLLGEFMKGAKSPDISAVTNLDLQKIVNSFLESVEGAEAIAGTILESFRNSKEHVTEVIAEADYNECRIDYAGFVEPVTNSVLQWALEKICAGYFEDIIIAVEICENLPQFSAKEQSAWGRKSM